MPFRKLLLDLTGFVRLELYRKRRENLRCLPCFGVTLLSQVPAIIKLCSLPIAPAERSMICNRRSSP
jgi:hypothetical protein